MGAVAELVADTTSSTEERVSDSEVWKDMPGLGQYVLLQMDPLLF
jgi:hypothetical protein